MFTPLLHRQLGEVQCVRADVDLVERLVDPDKPVGLVEWKRPRERGLDDGEDRGVGADAEGGTRTAATVNPGDLAIERRAWRRSFIS
jgi:hypothetical protein